MRSFQEKLDEFEKRGVRLIAISVDPVATNKQHAEKQGFKFALLSDEKVEVTRRYSLLHEKGYRDADISRPAEFVIAGDGTILWANITEFYTVRTKGEEVLKVLDDLAKK